jgi:hypothetical protein
LKVAIAIRKPPEGDLGSTPNILWSMATHECGDLVRGKWFGRDLNTTKQTPFSNRILTIIGVGTSIVNDCDYKCITINDLLL